jgi:drug/metabolite transporter (DMT)-like permease
MRRHRRHHRRRNPSNEELLTLGLGAVGGALAMYLYVRSIQQAAAAQTSSLTVTAPPAAA